MGQYYLSVLVDKHNNKIVYDNEVNGEWQGLKLCEHSWFMNNLVNGVAFELLNSPKRVFWLGDYAEETDVSKEDWELLKDVWNKETQRKKLTFDSKQNCLGLYLINHTKKEIVDMYKFFVYSSKQPDCTMIMHPLSLLTAVGNGRGGGDYYEKCINADKIGRWAGDLIELVEWERKRDLKEQGYIDKTEEYIFVDE